jgi:hypothetical protein
MHLGQVGSLVAGAVNRPFRAEHRPDEAGCNPPWWVCPDDPTPTPWVGYNDVTE